MWYNVSVRPLLLLDIDGVLCPFGPSPSYVWDDELQVYWSSQSRMSLWRLSRSFQCVWASMRGDHANDDIGKLYGLPALDAIEFRTVNLTKQTFKLQGVIDYIGDRPAAWLDDHLYDDGLVWAERRTKTVPTLAIRVDPYAGFAPDHEVKLADFAAKCGNLAPTP